MDLKSSISYKRFIKETYETFRNQHLNDIIDFLEKNDTVTFDEYLKDAEVFFDIQELFIHSLTPISKDLGLDVQEAIELENRISIHKVVYEDFKLYMKPKLKGEISELAAYYDFAERIK